jgi:small multidrug resistance pump
MSWGYLLLAIVLEVCGTTAMKLSHGFTRLGPSIAMVVFYILCFSALTMTLKKPDVSIAYAVWSGVGAALIAVIGVVWFREAVTPLKLASLALIIVGVVGLHLSGGIR